MSIATIVTHGYGNGTFDGNIPDIVTFGYSQPAEEEARQLGGWVPPQQKPRKLRKKDESVLEDIYKVIESLNEVPEPKLQARAQKVEAKAKTVIKLESNPEYIRQMKNLIAQVDRLERAVAKHARETAEHNKAAIRLLMEVM